MKRWLLLFFSSALIVFARLWNWPQIVVDGKVYFVDADCYSRMSRVAAVLASPGTILRHHDFENWPMGTTPHTTAPLDYLIAVLSWTIGNVDFAGAVVPVLLALAAGGVLWRWVRQFRFVTQIGVLLVFAISPILVHGTVFGRPDHQALLILFLVVAWAAEWEMQKDSPSRRAAILHGLAWGLAVWTSLFEPLLLLGASSVLGLLIWRKTWFTRSRIQSALVFGSVLLVALAIEQWRPVSLPSGPLFQRWSRSIGELAPVGWISMTYLQWFGISLLFLPGIFLWRIFREKDLSALFWGSILFVNYLFCVSAARWGYFMGLAMLFALPFFLEKFPLRWAGTLFFAGFWPVAADWDARLWPAQAEQDRVAEQREDYRQLREICAQIDAGGVLAPWWLSPPIAYWSGANCIAGSSHQSLPGNADAAAFYLSRFPDQARAILARRQVRWVLAYEPSRVLSTASSLLDEPASRDALAITLYDHPRRAPGFLKLSASTDFFRLYQVVEPPKTR